MFRDARIFASPLPAKKIILGGLNVVFDNKKVTINLLNGNQKGKGVFLFYIKHFVMSKRIFSSVI